MTSVAMILAKRNHMTPNDEIQTVQGMDMDGLWREMKDILAENDVNSLQLQLFQL